MALSWGYGGVDYRYFESISVEDLERETQSMRLLLNGSLAETAQRRRKGSRSSGFDMPGK